MNIRPNADRGTPPTPSLSFVPAPITRKSHLPILSYDILSTIFQIYVKDILSPCPNRPSWPYIYEGPLLVSHVCRYWRNVAFSTPKIWSSLNINRRLPYSLISQFLTLAGNYPLSLHISLWSYDGDHLDSRILDTLLSRITRWQCIRIWFDEDTAVEILQRFEEARRAGFFCAQTCEPSILEEAISEGVCVPRETSRNLWLFFLDHNRFPCLRRLHWSLDTSFMSSLDFMRTNCAQPNPARLTHLSFTSPPTMAECLLLLQQRMSLQSLIIDF